MADAGLGFSSQNSAAQDANAEPSRSRSDASCPITCPKGAKYDMNEVIERLRKRGIHYRSGCIQPARHPSAENWPGWPEGYPLPDGYVRHYQATDDGQRIEPILMFAPDKPDFRCQQQADRDPCRSRRCRQNWPGFPIRIEGIHPR